MNIYINKKLFSIFILFSLVFTFLCENALAAEAKSKPVYLRLESPYVVSDVTPKDLFIDTLLSKELSKEKNLEPDSQASTRYISLCAVKSALDEYGTIPSCQTFSELKSALVDTNEFSLSDDLSGAQVGDLVFYEDCPGVVVSEGKVLYVTADYQPFTMDLKKLDGAELISVIYPYYEQLAILYMVNTEGYSREKAIGILANLHAESLTDPTRLESSNQMGYGIAQWSKDRRLDLELYCATEKKNLSSLYAQLDFIDYELKNRTDLKGLDRQLNSVTADEDGTYDAAFLFCEAFENPMNATDSAVDRGVSVMDTFYPLYGSLELPE